MYGYVRPLKGELRVREYETFRGVYCGLCHALGRKYGPLLRWAVSYDMTFLAMLLCREREVTVRRRRCPWRPWRAAPCPEALPALEDAADMTVLLAWWKLRDGAQDSRFPKSLGYRLLAALTRPACRRAERARPAMGRAAAELLGRLRALEEARSPSLDETADCFASLLAAAAEGEGPRGRVLRELLYHLGRIVYLLDAADDLEEDIRAGAYNPLRYRFDTGEAGLAPADREELRLLLRHSHNSVCAAFALLDRGAYTDILENILCLGVPAMARAVLDAPPGGRCRGRSLRGSGRPGGGSQQSEDRSGL